MGRHGETEEAVGLPLVDDGAVDVDVELGGGADQHGHHGHRGHHQPRHHCTDNISVKKMDLDSMAEFSGKCVNLEFRIAEIVQFPWKLFLKT